MDVMPKNKTPKIVKVGNLSHKVADKYTKNPKKDDIIYIIRKGTSFFIFICLCAENDCGCLVLHSLNSSNNNSLQQKVFLLIDCFLCLLQ